MIGQTQKSHRAAIPGGHRIRTLVVEDSSPVRRAISYFLQGQKNIELVATAADGWDAMKKADAAHPELVVTDWQMPGMDGLELALYLRKHYADIKIILITVYDSPELRQAALDSGADGFIRTDRLHAEFSAEVRRLFSPPLS